MTLSCDDLAPRAVRDIDAALDDLRLVVARSQAVSEVFPVWMECRRLVTAVTHLTDLAAEKADALLEETTTCPS